MNVCVGGSLSDVDGVRWGSFSFQTAAEESLCARWTCVVNDVIVCAGEMMFYCLPRALRLFVKGDIDWIDVTGYVERLVSGA